MPLTVPDQTIAAQGKLPTVSDALTPIAQMVNIQGGIQRNKLGAIELQRETQANQERLNLQQFTLNPDNWQTDGRIDMDKINAAVPKIAPYTGGDWIGKMSQLSTAQTQAENAKLNFSTAERQIVGNLYGVMGRAGVKDPNLVAAGLDDLKDQYPDNPNMRKYIDAAKVGLGHMQPGDAVTKALVTNSQSLMGPAEQQAALSPNASLINTGGNLNETINQPSVGGNAPNITMTGRSQPLTLPPGQQESVTTDPYGNPAVVHRAPTGEITGTRIVPGAGVQSLPPGETLQSLADVKLIRKQANDAAANAYAEHNNNKYISQLADETDTGKGAEIVARLTGGYAALPWTSDNAVNFAQLQHRMALQTVELANRAGINGSDAGRALAGVTANNPDSPREAAKSIAKLNDALATGSQMYNAAMEKATGAGNAFAARDVKNLWGRVADVDVMRLYNAKQNGDVNEYGKVQQQNSLLTLKQWNALTPQGRTAALNKSAQWQNLMMKAAAMDKLVKTGSLQ